MIKSGFAPRHLLYIVTKTIIIIIIIMSIANFQQVNILDMNVSDLDKKWLEFISGFADLPLVC